MATQQTTQPLHHSATTLSGSLKQLVTKLGGKPVILVQGAAGNIGHYIVESLCNKANNFVIVAGVSDPSDSCVPKLQKLSNVEVIHLDLNNHELVDNAFELNVQKLVLIPPYTNIRVNLLNRLTDIAHRKGVKHVLLITSIGAQTEANDFFRDLKHIQNKVRSYQEDYNWNLLGLGPLMDTLMELSSHIKQGTLPLPIGSNKLPLLCAKDVGNLVAKVLIDGGLDKEFVDITGPEALGGEDIANILSQNLGKKVEYNSVRTNEFRTLAIQGGMDIGKAEAIKDLYGWYGQGNFNKTTGDFERLTGSKPCTFNEFVKNNLECFR